MYQDPRLRNRDSAEKMGPPRRASSGPRPENGEATIGDDSAAVGGFGDARQPSPSPHPEHQAVAYTRQAGHLRRIWIRQAGKVVEEPISPTELDCTSPSFSPDGSALVFTCLEGGQSRLYLFDRPSHRLTLVFQEALSVSNPVWVKANGRREAGRRLEVGGEPETAEW